jgi:hypothetical protein
VRVSRSHNAPFVTGDVSRPYWLAHYGDIAENDTVVVFIEQKEEPCLTVVPSRTGEQDLITLIRDILPIVAIEQGVERRDAWQSCLASTASDQMRKIALRSLIREGAEWTQFAGAMEGVLASRELSPDMRIFCFGIMVFGLKEGHWTSAHDQVAEFLCHMLTAESDPNLLLQYVLNIKLLLNYCGRKLPERERLQSQLFDCLKRREAAGPLDSQVLHQYDDIRTAFPGRL